jgi:hypothetical protein
MTRRCMNAWCCGEAEPGRDVCAWCWQHRGYVNGAPRDPRHPWFEGRLGARPPDPIKRYFPDLVRGDR